MPFFPSNLHPSPHAMHHAVGQSDVSSDTVTVLLTQLLHLLFIDAYLTAFPARRQSFPRRRRVCHSLARSSTAHPQSQSPRPDHSNQRPSRRRAKPGRPPTRTPAFLPHGCQLIQSRKMRGRWVDMQLERMQPNLRPQANHRLPPPSLPLSRQD